MERMGETLPPALIMSSMPSVLSGFSWNLQFNKWSGRSIHPAPSVWNCANLCSGVSPWSSVPSRDWLAMRVTVAALLYVSTLYQLWLQTFSATSHKTLRTLLLKYSDISEGYRLGRNKELFRVPMCSSFYLFLHSSLPPVVLNMLFNS